MVVIETEHLGRGRREGGAVRTYTHTHTHCTIGKYTCTVYGALVCLLTHTHTYIY